MFPSQDIYRTIAIRNERDVVTSFSITSMQRKDIVGLYNNEEYLMAGFECIVDLDNFSKYDTVDILVGYKNNENIIAKKLKTISLEKFFS